MGYGKQYAWHTAVTVASTVITGALFYILRIVLYDNRLTPEEYGLYFSVYAFAMMVQPIVSFGFDPGLVPHITQFREENDPPSIKNVALGSMFVQLAIATCCGMIALALIPVFRRCFPGQPEIGILVVIFAFHAAGLIVFKVGQQFFLGMQALVWRNVADIVRAVVCVSAALLLADKAFDRDTSLMAGVRGAALAYLLAAAGAIFVQALGFAISFPEMLRPRFQWRPELVKGAFSGGKYLSLAFGGLAIFSSLDTAMITIVRGDLLEVAAFQIALPTAMIIYSLLTAAGLSFMPMARTLWVRDERELLADGISRIYEAACATVIVGGVLMAAFSDVLMRFLFGKDIMNAPEAFNVLAVAGVFYFLAYLNLHILAGIGRARAAAVVVIAALALDLVLDPPLIYFLGIQGAALASFIGYLAATALGFRAIRAELPVSMPWKTIGAASILACICWYLCHLFRSTSVFTEDGIVPAACAGAVLLTLSTVALEWTGCTRLRELARVVVPKGKLV